ncbi:hypothetical protein NQ317_018679 [Molorchus minor]|uniref:Integrase catalytic domain-containing protein n=1 Tax=Molorchus minor TaxID=1323400 RepID=A0ABQ9JB49_9CUCU|nr:hypothetical protein NQ317_018679 [Molorchus minor]
MKGPETGPGERAQRSSGEPSDTGYWLNGAKYGGLLGPLIWPVGRAENLLGGAGQFKNKILRARSVRKQKYDYWNALGKVFTIDEGFFVRSGSGPTTGNNSGKQERFVRSGSGPTKINKTESYSYYGFLLGALCLSLAGVTYRVRRGQLLNLSQCFTVYRTTDFLDLGLISANTSRHTELPTFWDLASGTDIEYKLAPLAGGEFHNTRTNLAYLLFYYENEHENEYKNYPECYDSNRDENYENPDFQPTENTESGENENFRALASEIPFNPILFRIQSKERYSFHFRKYSTFPKNTGNHRESHHNIPKRIVSDNGTEFNNNTLKEYFQLINVELHLTTEANPNSNALIERLHSTLLEKLRIINIKDPKQSPENQMITAIFIYNNSIHSTTKYSPFSILYGPYIHELDFNLDEDVYENNTQKRKAEIVPFIEQINKKTIQRNTTAINKANEKRNDDTPETNLCSKNGLPIIQNTHLGWIVSGEVSGAKPKGKASQKIVCNLSVNSEIQDQLTRFWQLEETGSEECVISSDDIECERLFVNTTYRNCDGRFVVSIPFKDSPTKLGDSKQMALTRLLSLERRFSRNQNFKRDYLNEKQRPLQRILWRDDPSQEVEVYNLNTVTFGLASSPFLAVRCVKQLALDFVGTNPKASEVLSRDFYVDDMLSGADSEEEAIQICRNVSDILGSGGFDLRKLNSNSKNVLSHLKNLNESNVLSLGQNEKTKTLGLYRACDEDNLTYQVGFNSSDKGSITKRKILSEISQIFDPLGLVCACIIIPKVILQQLWSFNLSWDDDVPISLASEWQRFNKELLVLNTMSIPKFVCCEDYQTMEIHGFSDASLTAYAACIYVRSIDAQGTVESNLLCAKAKVAPIKTLTVPKLELCGAFLLAKLLKMVQSSLHIDKVFLWCDSTVVIMENSGLNLFHKYSSYVKLKRVVACVRRFIWNRVVNHRDPQNHKRGPLSPEELNDSEKCLVRMAQGESFSDEIKALRKGEKLNKGSLSSLCPFIDEDDGLYVSVGDFSCQIFLTKRNTLLCFFSSKHILTKLILIQEHQRLLHSGPQMLLSSIRERFWSVGGRTLVRQMVHECIRCVELNLLHCNHKWEFYLKHRQQKLVQLFWSRWTLEYVSKLQNRTKWKCIQDDLKKDMLVVVKDKDTHPLCWRLGRATTIHPGPDGVARVATIRTADGPIKRSFSKLCPLKVKVDVCFSNDFLKFTRIKWRFNTLQIQI